MKFLFIITSALMLSIPALSNDDPTSIEGNNNKQVVQICNAAPESKETCKAPKVVTKWRTKVVEKEKEVIREIVKEVPSELKNRISILAGFGALGTLEQTATTTGTIVNSRQGFVIGIQGMRDIYTETDLSVHVLIQVQSSKTLLGGVGIGF